MILYELLYLMYRYFFRSVILFLLFFKKIMGSFWHQFLVDASPFENCVFVTRDGVRYSTHKILAARHGFLRSLLLGEDPEEESLLLLPDFSQEEVEEVLQVNTIQTETDSKEMQVS